MAHLKLFLLNRRLHKQTFILTQLFVRTLGVVPPGFPGGTTDGTWRPDGPPGMPKNTDPEAKKTLWKPPRDYAYDRVVRHCPACQRKFGRRNMMLQHVMDSSDCSEKIDIDTLTIMHHEFARRKFNNKKYRKW